MTDESNVNMLVGGMLTNQQPLHYLQVHLISATF